MTATYEQTSKKRDALDPWVRFIQDLGSDEWTDYVDRMFNAASSAVAIDDDAALTVFGIVEAEIDRARAEFLDEQVDEYAVETPSVVEVYERLKSEGVLQWPRKPTNADVRAQLALCGDGGDTDSAWHPDELIKLAKMLREKGF